MKNLAVFFLVAVIIGLAMIVGRAVTDRHSPTPSPSGSAQIPSIGRLQILNGSHCDKGAWRVADMLRKKGFDVKNDGIGNAMSFNYPQTLIISRTTDTKNARQVGQALQLAADRVIIMRNGEERFDVTVILGADCEEILP